MPQLRPFAPFVLVLLLVIGLTGSLAAQSPSSQQHTSGLQAYPLDWIEQFVPSSRTFWEDSLNWTTNYGPSFRDTVIGPSNMLACSNQFALCFHSGPEPFPCTLSADGRSADCLCTVATTTNYTLISAINNRDVYDATVARCGKDGSGCTQTGDAPVCGYLQGGTLMPGANVISTFDPESRLEILKAISSGTGGATSCPKGPYAGCMTAPCLLNGDGTASCKCPVFYGNFQLTQSNAQCSLGGNLVPSASYIPILDTNRNN